MADKQIKINTGIATIHFSPKTIGTYMGAKLDCNKTIGIIIIAIVFKLFIYRDLNSCIFALAPHR